MSPAAAAHRVLVVGSGAVGLRTALELLRSNINVVLRAPVPPLHESTCSMGAGGLWMPVYCNDPRANHWANQTLDELLSTKNNTKIKNRNIKTKSKRKKYYPIPKGLVEIVPTVLLKRDLPEELPEWAQTDDRIRFQQLTVEELSERNTTFHNKLKIPPLEELSEAGYRYAHLFYPPIVDAPKMLQHMLQEIKDHPLEADVNVETGETYSSLEELRQLGNDHDCSTVINCTGLGANQIKTTKNDAEEKKKESDTDGMVGARGVLLHYDRKTCQRRPEIAAPGGSMTIHHDAVIMTEDPPWAATKEEPCYLIPRGDVVLVGGSYLPGSDANELQSKERERLLLNSHRLGIDAAASQPVHEWTGFRPYRSSGIRCEYHDDDDGGGEKIPVIHNYGHGGSGWTLNVGTAKHVVHELLLPRLLSEESNKKAA